MSITPSTFYRSFQYNNIRIDRNMDGDFISGCLIALTSSLLRNGNITSDKLVTIDNKIDITLDRTTYLSRLGNYYLASSSKDKVSPDIKLPIKEQFMGIWIKMPYIEELDLYTFTEDNFIEGFIYMSNDVLQQDFREGIYGGPFIYNNGYNFIDLLNYDVPPMPNINKKVPNFPEANNVS